MMNEEDNAKFTESDSVVLANVLNEVLRGFHIANFEREIGESKRFVLELEQTINSRTLNSKLDSLSHTELSVLRNATKKAESELGDEDFYTRIGVPPISVYGIIDRAGGPRDSNNRPQ